MLLFVRFLLVFDYLLIAWWTIAAILPFRFRCFTLYRLNCLCSIPVWCLEKDEEFDWIGSWSLLCRLGSWSLPCRLIFMSLNEDGDAQSLAYPTRFFAILSRSGYFRRSYTRGPKTTPCMTSECRRWVPNRTFPDQKCIYFSIKLII